MRQKSENKHCEKLLFFKIKRNLNYRYDGTDPNFLGGETESPRTFRCYIDSVHECCRFVRFASFGRQTARYLYFSDTTSINDINSSLNNLTFSKLFLKYF